MDEKIMEQQARENVESLAEQFRKELAMAAYLGVEIINHNKKEAIEKINEIASQKANKILKALEDANKSPAIKVVKKYWGGIQQDHFFGDQTKLGD